MESPFLATKGIQLGVYRRQATDGNHHKMTLLRQPDFPLLGGGGTMPPYQHANKEKERYMRSLLKQFKPTISLRDHTERQSTIAQTETHHNENRKYGQIDMSSYSNRSITFELAPAWPKPNIPVLQLASVGLYYTGIEDLTRCFSCCVDIFDWDEKSDPLKRHFISSPNCPFIRKVFQQEIEQFCKKDFAMYSSYEYRSALFRYWPIPLQVGVDKLASAGWYYTGSDVTTQCFTCGIICTDWVKGDDPLIKHKVLNANCSFLLNEQLQTSANSKYSCSLVDYCREPLGKCDKYIETRDLYKPKINYDDSSTASKQISEFPASYNESKKHPVNYYNSPQSTDNNESDDDECVVCLTNSKQYAVIPCGHLCLCKECSERLTNCPVCRCLIKDILKVYVT